ncbi:hypothetical protein EJ110_NYTH22014, partial [Nymphaea thermarum]
MDQPNSSILSSSFLSQLISQKLNHSNYLTWKRQIVPFIKSHRLYGHIDDTTPAPPQYIDREVKRTVVADQGGGASTGSEIRFEYETVTENNPAYEVWLAHDQSLVAYITSTLSEEVSGGVDDDLTALELWSTLATTYSQVSEARFLQLRRQFQDIKRGTRTVLEYLNEIKSVSDQLAAIGHPAKLFQHEASRVQRQNLISSNNHNVLIQGLMQCKGIVPVLGPLRQEWEEVFFQPLQDPKATPMTLNDKNETYDTWLHAEILRQGAEMLPKQKEQATNEPETIVDTSLDSTASLENMSSSPQQDDDPPRDNRFSSLVYSRRTVPTIAPRQSQRVRHPIDRW